MLLGCLGQLAGVCAFAVYLALAISQRQGSSSDSEQPLGLNEAVENWQYTVFQKKFTPRTFMITV